MVERRKETQRTDGKIEIPREGILQAWADKKSGSGGSGNKDWTSRRHENDHGMEWNSDARQLVPCKYKGKTGDYNHTKEGGRDTGGEQTTLHKNGKRGRVQCG